MSYCRDCGAEISWLYMRDRRYIPVDPKPVFFIEGEGMERFCDEEQGTFATGRRAKPEEVQTREQKLNTPLGFVPHWRTCWAWPAIRPRYRDRGV